MLANEFDRTAEEYFGTEMLAASVPHSGESRSEPQRARNENAAMNWGGGGVPWPCPRTYTAH